MNELARVAAFLLSCVTEPKAAMARARATGLRHQEIWALIAVASVARVLEAVILSGPMIPLPLGERTVEATPLAFFTILCGGAAITVFVLHYTAKMLGGKGDFEGALWTIALVEWLVVVLFGVQIIFLYFLPALIGFATTLSIIIMLITLLNFINIVEEFDSLLKALLTVILGIIGVSIGATFIILVIGGASILQP